MLVAVPPGQAAGALGEAAAAHGPVLPAGRGHVRGAVPGVGLQTPLERRAHWPTDGSPGGCVDGETHQMCVWGYDDDDNTNNNCVFV